MERYPEAITFSLKFSLVAKCNAHFIFKKISQLKSYIRSCRCNKELQSGKQASGLIGGGTPLQLTLKCGHKILE